MEAANSKEYSIKLESKDGISRARFSPFPEVSTRDILVASSWDSSVTVYNANPAVAKSISTYRHSAAVLDCTFGATVHSIISGGLDTTLITYDVTTKLETKIGNHEKAISVVEYNQDVSIIITGSWDKTLKLWDPRQGNALLQTVVQPDKVYSMDTFAYNIIVAHNNRHIRVFDMRKLSQDPTHVWRESKSPMKFQTRCVRAFPDYSGFALGSIEGRVAVEYFDIEGPAGKFAFRCHRENNEIFPVNAISFHPTYGTFATGGGDGNINVWDAKNKKKISQYPKRQTSVASLSFSSDGGKLAIAASYTYERGQLPQTPPNTLSVRFVQDEEVRPKPKKI